MNVLIHVVRCGAFVFVSHQINEGETPSLPAGVPGMRVLDLAMGTAFFICVAVGVAWLYFASVNAHVLSPRMKYSPRVGMAWFFVPLLNQIMPFSVVYDIWTASGGGRGGGRLVGLWWSLSVLSGILCFAWKLGLNPNPIVQAVLAGATLSFFVLAKTIDRLQRERAKLSVFGDEEVKTGKVIFAEIFMPEKSKPVIDDLQPEQKEWRFQPSSAPQMPLKPGDLGTPGVIYVSRQDPED